MEEKSHCSLCPKEIFLVTDNGVNKYLERTGKDGNENLTNISQRCCDYINQGGSSIWTNVGDVSFCKAEICRGHIAWSAPSVRCLGAGCIPTNSSVSKECCLIDDLFYWGDTDSTCYQCNPNTQYNEETNLYVNSGDVNTRITTANCCGYAGGGWVGGECIKEPCSISYNQSRISLVGGFANFEGVQGFTLKGATGNQPSLIGHTNPGTVSDVSYQYEVVGEGGDLFGWGFINGPQWIYGDEDEYGSVGEVGGTAYSVAPFIRPRSAITPKTVDLTKGDSYLFIRITIDDRHCRTKHVLGLTIGAFGRDNDGLIFSNFTDEELALNSPFWTVSGSGNFGQDNTLPFEDYLFRNADHTYPEYIPGNLIPFDFRGEIRNHKYFKCGVISITHY